MPVENPRQIPAFRYSKRYGPIPPCFARATRIKTPTKSPVDRMFRAFSDRTRLRILNLLRPGELCVCDLVRVLGAPQPTVSRHLAYLRKAGLVTARRDGLWMHYRLAPAASGFHRSAQRCDQLIGALQQQLVARAFECIDDT